MPSLDAQRFPPPTNWQDFERLCRDLWAEIWQDPTTQANGRSGQKQHGVDVSGQPKRGSAWAGVQCKGKTYGYHAALTKKELHAEVEKAKTFTPRLREFIVATTAPKDAAIEREARILSERLRRKRLFRVRVWGWEDVVQQMCRYPELIDKHYPLQGPTLNAMARNIASIHAAIEARNAQARPPPDASRQAGDALSDRLKPIVLFVSSRMVKELARERQIVARTVDAFGGVATAWTWEQNGVGGGSQRSLCLSAARQASMLVLLLRNEVSPIVRAEFKAAHDAGATCLVFAKRAASVTPECRRFISRLTRLGIRPLQFRNHSELRLRVVDELRRVILERVHAGRSQR